MVEHILQIFPAELRRMLASNEKDLSRMEEIRVRINKPLLFLDGRREWYLNGQSGRLSQDAGHSYCIKADDIQAILTFLSRYSIYAYEEELKSGFLTLEGGHRVGIAGQMRMEGGKVMQLAYAGAFNIRISHEKKGCAREILPYLVHGEQVWNTLIASPAGIGKTTLLRDCIRLLSGDETSRIHFKVGVIDERSELAACYHGIPQNDLGIRTDVMDRCQKAAGMQMLLRSMSPEVIAVDELGAKEDFAAVDEVLNCGCSIVGTVHAASRKELQQKVQLGKWLKEQIFDRYVILKKAMDGKRHFEIYDGAWQKIWSD